MYFLFLLLIGCLVFVTLLNRGRPGVLEITVASFLVYILPYLLGFVVNPDNKEIEVFGSREYLVMAIPAFLMLVWAGFIVMQSVPQTVTQVLDVPQSAVFALYACVLLLLLVMLRDLGDVAHLNRILSKREMNELSSGFGSLFFINFFSSAAAALAVYTRRYLVLLFLFFVCFIQFTIFQSRSALAFTLIATALALFNTWPSPGIARKLVLGLVGASLVLFMVIYKSIKGRLLTGQTDRIEGIASAEFWYNVFQTYEPQKTTFLLKLVVEEKVSFPAMNFWSSLAEVIPLSETLFGITNQKWGKLLVDQYYSGERGYWADNIFAEFFSYFGHFGVLSFCVFWLAFLLALHFILNGDSLWRKVYVIAVIPTVCFFLHRTAFGPVLSTAVNTVVVLAVIHISSALGVMILPWSGSREVEGRHE